MFDRCPCLGLFEQLAGVRGARGRARAVRDAARDGTPIKAVLAGLRPVHRGQTDLFAADLPSVSDANGTRRSRAALLPAARGAIAV